MSPKMKCPATIAMAAISAGVLMSADVHAAPIAYQSQVLSESPYAYYQFNDTGASAADATGNGFTGSYVASPTQGIAGAGSPTDNAVLLNGSSQYMSSPAKAFGALVATSSYEFVFKVNSGFSTATTPYLFGSGVSSHQNINVQLDENGANSAVATPNDIRFFVRDNSGSGNASVSFHNTSWADGNYHDLIFTFGYNGTSDTFHAYLDGVSQTFDTAFGSTSGAGGFVAFANNPYFGQLDNNGAPVASGYSNVTLDEAALYNTVLDSTPVNNNYAALTGTPEPGSIALLAVAGIGLLGRRRRLA